ncbi:hypothetical protein ACFV0T_40120 [Streptomyces sp. NPDC059582]|uniref:hypothetical protein n=1 Tax=Streptomyces sp. NPDC059582 TaxID=3346875 RepID=UPI003682D544
MRSPMLRRTVLVTTFAAHILTLCQPDAAFAVGEGSPVCPRPEPADRLMVLFPYLWLVVVVGLLVGLLTGWLSHRGGDNTWESARQGLATGLATTGPLLTVVGLLAILPPVCP